MMLQLTNLSFRYSAQTTRYQFSLNLAAGKIAAVHGNSGSGKSTLLDLISGFLHPTSGQLSWHGKSFINKRPKDRPVTFVFQRNNLFEHLSAVNNVLVGIDPTLPVSGKNFQSAVAALESVGLGDHIEQRTSTLSGGQQQRVAIARASLRDKSILLLDEPFSALDPTTRTEMLNLVRQIANKHQSSIVMVTHDKRDADAIADQRYLLLDGQLILQNDE